MLLNKIIKTRRITYKCIIYSLTNQFIVYYMCYKHCNREVILIKIDKCHLFFLYPSRKIGKGYKGYCSEKVKTDPSYIRKFKSGSDYILFSTIEFHFEINEMHIHAYSCMNTRSSVSVIIKTNNRPYYQYLFIFDFRIFNFSIVILSNGNFTLFKYASL